MRLYGLNSQETLPARNDDRDDDRPLERASRIEYFCEPGVYYLKIEAFRNSQGGTYTVHAEGP